MKSKSPAMIPCGAARLRAAQLGTLLHWATLLGVLLLGACETGPEPPAEPDLVASHSGETVRLEAASEGHLYLVVPLDGDAQEPDGQAVAGWRRERAVEVPAGALAVRLSIAAHCPPGSDCIVCIPDVDQPTDDCPPLPPPQRDQLLQELLSGRAFLWKPGSGN
jgi:hypothetical protein